MGGLNVAATVSYAVTTSALLSDGQFYVQDGDPISNVTPMRKLLLLYTDPAG